MALVEKRIGGFGTEVAFFITYDDVDMSLYSVRCINNGNFSAYGKATHYGGNPPVRSYDHVFQAHSDTSINIPVRFGISLIPNGRVDGVEYSFMYPYP